MTTNVFSLFCQNFNIANEYRTYLNFSDAQITQCSTKKGYIGLSPSFCRLCHSLEGALEQLLVRPKFTDFKPAIVQTVLKAAARRFIQIIKAKV
jgi:hypothetical protein